MMDQSVAGSLVRLVPGPKEGFGDRYWKASAHLALPPTLRPDQVDETVYRELADSLPTLCWIANADGYLTWYNRRWYDYTGTTPDQMEGWGWQSVHDPDVLPAVMAAWTGSIASGEPFEMVFPLRGADGDFRPFLTRIVPLRDAAGTIRRWVGNNVDISSQVAAEEELRRSREELAEAHRVSSEREAFLSGVLGSSTDCIKVLSLDGKLAFMNEGGQRAMEVSDFNAVAGCPWPDFWAGSGHADAVEAIEAARNGEARSFVGRADTMKGTPKWWHVAVSPIMGAEGRPERILSVSRDISNLRASEEDRDRFARLAENSQDFISMAHRDGRMSYLNDGARRLVGLEGVDVTQLTTADFFPEGEVERVRAEVMPAIERDGHWSGELCFRHFVTGELIPTLNSMFPTTDADGAMTGYGTVARDFRERKRLEDQQQLLNGELSHRLKNTLTVVQAIASQTLGGADPEAVAAFGRRLIALSTAHDVLLQTSWSAASVRAVAERVLATFDRGAQVTLDGPDVEMGSRATLALSLLLHELATNAIKYGALSTPAGHVALAWSVSGDGQDATVAMQWAERGGPPAVAPTRKGFGSRIIRMGLSGSGGVTLRYEEQGFTADLTATIAQLRQA